METPTFEQQQQTAKEVINELKHRPYTKGICDCLPGIGIYSTHPIKKYLPEYYDKIGYQIKETYTTIKRLQCMYWFTLDQQGHQQRIDTLKRVYNL